MPRKKIVRTKSPYKKVAEEKEEELIHDMGQPAKPDTDEEVRLYQVLLKGEGTHHITGAPIGLVHGTQKKWLTKSQAKALGLHWNEEPFVGVLRRGGKAND